MVKISRDNLERMLHISGTTFATIVTETLPAVKRPKTSGNAGRVKKWSKINVCLNFNYEAAVNRQLERENKEPNFKSAARSFGIRYEKTPIYHHNGQVYLQYKPESYLDVQYYLDDTPVQKEDLRDILDNKYFKETPVETRQGTDKPVQPFTVKLANIRKIFINKMEYVIE